MVPSADPVIVRLDAAGKPEPFTIKATGFAPQARVYVEQCDGMSPADPKWRPTVDCDVGTQTAGLLADASGAVTFPAGDRNYGFKPVRGESPENLFNCLASGDADPKNSLPSSSTCYVLVTANYTQPTPAQATLRMRFETATTSSSSNSHTVLVAVVVVAVVAGVAALVAARRRRLA